MTRRLDHRVKVAIIAMAVLAIGMIIYQIADALLR
jgi:hypothetical protein